MSDQRREIELGCTVRDVVTGLKGVAVARLERIEGHVEYGVQLTSIDSDRMGATVWIGWQRLDVLSPEPIRLPGLVREVDAAVRK